MNHGNLTRNPKLDSRELKSWPIKHRPLIMQMMQNSAHILCINEADAFLYPEEDKTLDLIKLFIKRGYKGIVIKLWLSKSIACFVRGGKHARVELLARYISTKSQFWSTTFGMFRCFFGLEEGCTDPDYDTPTSAAWHPPEHPCSSTRRSMLDRDCHHAQPFNGMARTVRLSSSTSSRTMRSVEHFQNPLRILFYPTTPAVSPELIFHLPPSECSISIRTSAMVQQKKTYRKVSCARYGVQVIRYNPESGLMNYITEKFKNLWNETQDMPLAERMDFTMSTSCTIKPIARHHLHMKEGSGDDRTLPDCMMTFVFSWGKTDIQQEFRRSEIAKLDQATMDSMIEDVDKVISDYLVTSAKRNNEMLMLGPCDSDSHTPLLVYVRSLAADQERNLHRKKDYIQNKKNGSHGTNPISKDGRTLATKDGRIMAEDMEVNPIAAIVGTRRSDEIL